MGQTVLQSCPSPFSWLELQTRQPERCKSNQRIATAQRNRKTVTAAGLSFFWGIRCLDLCNGALHSYLCSYKDSSNDKQIQMWVNNVCKTHKQDLTERETHRSLIIRKLILVSISSKSIKGEINN